MREDESGDSEAGDDEPPCMIGGEREGDSILHVACQRQLINAVF